MLRRSWKSPSHLPAQRLAGATRGIPKMKHQSGKFNMLWQ